MMFLSSFWLAQLVLLSYCSLNYSIEFMGTATSSVVPICCCDTDSLVLLLWYQVHLCDPLQAWTFVPASYGYMCASRTVPGSTAGYEKGATTPAGLTVFGVGLL